MKLKDVPQDHNPSFEGHTKLCYAIDESGKIVSAQTTGWKVEADATDIAWNAINKELEQMRRKVRQGQVSPLEYFMKLRLMDPSLLAENMGVSKWRLRWHLKPSVFRRLDGQWLARYAECLDLPVKTLKDYGGE